MSETKRMRYDWYRGVEIYADVGSRGGIHNYVVNNRNFRDFASATRYIDKIKK